MSDAAPTGSATLLAAAVAEREAGAIPAAIARLKDGIARDPRNAELFLELAETLNCAGDYRAAIEAYERAIALDPDYFRAYRAAADAALAQAKKAKAAGVAKASADLERFAAMYLVALGKRQHGQLLDDAEASFREAATLDPKSAEAQWGIATFLDSRGRHRDAEKPVRRAIALDPSLPHPYVTLGRIMQALGRYEESTPALRKALSLDPALRNVRESLASIPLMNMLYDTSATAASVYAAHRAWGESAVAAARHNARSDPSFPNSRDPERPLRVAFLSPDFRYHAVSFFFEPLLRHLDRRRIEVFCYADVEHPDPVSRFLTQVGGTWRNSFALQDEPLRAQIRADAIDIAVDLAGHTTNSRLHAMAVKPAPVTATWLGYPATTGLPTIDWRITDAIADPPGQESFHVERLKRMPATFLCYHDYMMPMPAVAPVPARTRGRIAFGSFNNIAKLSGATMAAWARIATDVPDSRLVLKAYGLVDPVSREKLRVRFAAAGFPAGRLDLREPQRDQAAHLGSYADIDIALDPFPYNGTTTTCEAMWMGVPVIALAGERHAGRVGLDLLTQVGVPELAAADVPSYVATAAALAGDLCRLESLRSALRDRMAASPLCDAPRFAVAFEGVLREMWREWCET